MLTGPGPELPGARCHPCPGERETVCVFTGPVGHPPASSPAATAQAESASADPPLITGHLAAIADSMTGRQRPENRSL